MHFQVMRLLSRVMALLFFCSVQTFLLAQENNKISLREALERVEQKQKVRFFFKYNSIKDILVDGVAVNRPVDAFLKEALRDTPLTYSYYKDKYIFILERTGSERQDSIPANQDDAGFVADGKFYTLSGYVRDANTGESIPGATLYFEELKVGTSSNAFGFYSITVPSGRYAVRISAVGRAVAQQKITLGKNTSLNIELFEQMTQLKDVVVTAEASDRNVSSIEMSLVRLDAKTMKSIPAFMGETDVIKSIMLLPGVSSVGDGASGFNVRGGNVDQNLILLDDVPVFNTSHLFGFFSTFNSDVIKDVTLYKGGIPAQYGGRIASVLDVTLKEGNAKELSGQGGVGVISSRLMLEGPLVKDKTSFLLGGRFAYPDWILKRVPDLNIRRSSGYFFDANLRIHHQINEQNNLFFSAYYSEDGFRLASDTTYDWSTLNATLKWNTLIRKKVFLNITGLFGNYKYGVEGETSPELFRADFRIKTKGLKADFSYFLNTKHKLDFGASIMDYDFNPGTLSAAEGSSINSRSIDAEQGTESGVYISDDFKISKGVAIQGGIRFSHYASVGPGQTFMYQEGVPKTPSTVVDTISYSSGESIRNYSGFEPRVSVKFGLTESSSVKLSYNRTIQYLHLISNSTAISPLDIWKSSNYHIKPQVGNQIAAGYFKNIRNNTIELSVEAYYKEIQNMLEYKDGAELFMNPLIEAEVLPAFGKAYGVEMMAKKNTGKLTGWIEYTYSRSLRRVAGNADQETINNGKFYPSNFDKPHDATLVMNYKITRRLSFSSTFTYSTGRPITYPNSVYLIDGYGVTQFSDRNEGRIQDYHRLDVSLTLDENLRLKQRWKGSWSLSIFNVYGRKNPYSVFFKPEYNGKIPQAYRLAVLGTVFPSITYNFKF